MFMRCAASKSRASNASPRAVKKTDVLVDGEPVGHSRDVIGDRAGAVALLRLGRPVARHGGRVGDIGRKQPPHDRVGLVPHRQHRRMAVHAGEQERLHVAVGGLDRGRVADERPARRRDRFGAVRPRLGDPPPALADRVLDEAGDDAAGQFMDDARLLEAGMAVVDLARPDRR